MLKKSNINNDKNNNSKSYCSLILNDLEICLQSF